MSVLAEAAGGTVLYEAVRDKHATLLAEADELGRGLLLSNPLTSTKSSNFN